MACPDDADQLHGAIFRGARLRRFEPFGGAFDAVIEFGLAARDGVKTQGANPFGCMGEAAVFSDIPSSLGAKELEAHLREHGDGICDLSKS